MKKHFLVLAALVAVFAVAFSGTPAMAYEELAVADFDTGDKPNNVGGDFGAWDKDPNDDTQWAKVSFVEDDAMGDPAGYALQIDYDVDSPNPAYNGIWMKFNGVDARAYNAISFYIRGEGYNNYTKRLKLEIKDMNNRPSPYIIGGITEEWQKITIPFEKFRRIQDWSALNEFIVVFDDINASPKQGTILIDHIALEAA